MRSLRQSVAVVAVQRRGITLIECATVISLIAAIGVMSIQSLASIMEMSRKNSEQASTLERLARLQNQFRQDVHLARQMEAGENLNAATRIELILSSDLKVTYDANEQGISRQQSGSVNRKEFFAFPGTNATFSREGDIVALTVNAIAAGLAFSPKMKSPGTDVPVKLVARIGYANRHENRNSSTGKEQN